MDFAKLLVILIYFVLVSNVILAQFLGLCPFLGVSKKTSSSIGMGMAVTFVMTMASAVAWLIYNYALLPGETNLLYRFFSHFRDGLDPAAFDLTFLNTLTFILTIATLVQFVEMVLRKFTPALYQALGIYLPLITTNCAVLGMAMLLTVKAAAPYRFHEALVGGAAGGLSFTLAMVLMSGVREKLENLPVPEALRGAPITFIATGLMALAFMGFANLASL